MSKFADKLLRGESTTGEEWYEHMIEAHRIAPSMTSEAFSSHNTQGGVSSYEFLVQSAVSLGTADCIVDLACGNGYLLNYIIPQLKADSKVIGIDMSDAELKVAKDTYTDSRVTFVNSRAHSLPVEVQSVDVLFCHMAFMLMTPIEPVISEISRVLKPTGQFSAIVANPKAAMGLFAEILSAVSTFLNSRFPAIKEARLGDPRVTTKAGIESLFLSTGSHLVVEDITEFEITIRCGLDGLWKFMKDMYVIGMLPNEDKVLLLNDLKSLGSKQLNSAGQLEFGFPMLRFSTRKTGSSGFQTSKT